jgi:hypothetical protein
MPLACSAADFTVGGALSENQLSAGDMLTDENINAYTYERWFVAEIEVPFITPYLHSL